MIIFENQDPDCQTLKAASYSLKSPHFEPRFLHLANNMKILIHCLCNFNAEDDSNVVLRLTWLYKCCKHSSSWVISVSDQERPGATSSDQERPGATRSDQERPGATRTPKLKMTAGACQGRPGVLVPLVPTRADQGRPEDQNGL